MIFKKSFLSETKTIKDAILNLNNSGLKIICVVDKKLKLLGTITDGDIRRALLKNFSLDVKVSRIMNYSPLTIKDNENNRKKNFILKKYKLSSLPVVNKNKKVIDIFFSSNNSNLENIFYIIAGGRGSRMMPLTKNSPKPMLFYNGQIIIENIIEKARQDGFVNICISVKYLAKKIIDYLEKYKKTEINIKFFKETKSLGTAGSLTNLYSKKNNTPIVVTNSDLISNLNYKDILQFHNFNKADVTIAIKNYRFQNPYGVVSFKNHIVNNIEEKPIYSSYVNAGVYVINPNLLKVVKKNSYLDMPDFLKKLISKKKKLIVFPLHEQWKDLQKPNDLE
jgi:dTDP-glucose pyrophosphorylase/predicted transcriptional regulator